MDIYFFQNGSSELTNRILRLLPDWFGIESSIVEYAEFASHYPQFIAFVDGVGVGFISLKRTSTVCSEIYVMAVEPQFHGRGLGRALLEKAEEYLRSQGVEFFQVKTLGEAHESVQYKRTREFYRVMGFKDIETFKELWDPSNPCLLMMKSLR